MFWETQQQWSYYHSVYSCPFCCRLNSTTSPPDCDPSTSLGERMHRVSQNRLKCIPNPGPPDTLFSTTQRLSPFCFHSCKCERAPFVTTQIKDQQTYLRHCSSPSPAVVSVFLSWWQYHKTFLSQPNPFFCRLILALWYIDKWLDDIFFSQPFFSTW